MRLLANLASLLLAFTLFAVPAVADPDPRTPTSVPVAQAADPLRDALTALKVPDTLRAAVAGAVRGASGDFTIHRADGVRPRMVATLRGALQLEMDLDFQEPMTGKLRIERDGEAFTLSATDGRLTTRYTKRSKTTLQEDSSQPLELAGTGAKKFVSLTIKKHEVSFATEQELVLAKAQMGRLLESYEHRTQPGGGHVFTKASYDVDGRPLALDELRAFLAKRVVNPPQI